LNVVLRPNGVIGSAGLLSGVETDNIIDGEVILW